jgi:ribosomal protein L32
MSDRNILRFDPFRVDDKMDPTSIWPFRKLGLKPEDLVTNLWSEFDNVSIPLQDVHSFSYDVRWCAHTYDIEAAFRDALQARKEQRIDEIEACLYPSRLSRLRQPILPHLRSKIRFRDVVGNVEGILPDSKLTSYGDLALGYIAQPSYERFARFMGTLTSNEELERRPRVGVPSTPAPQQSPKPENSPAQSTPIRSTPAQTPFPSSPSLVDTLTPTAIFPKDSSFPHDPGRLPPDDSRPRDNECLDTPAATPPNDPPRSHDTASLPQIPHCPTTKEVIINHRPTPEVSLRQRNAKRQA